MILPSADPGRIGADLDVFRRFTLAEQPFTRRAFSPEYLAARAWLQERMLTSGLDASVDAAGNLVGVRPSSLVHASSVVLGSHSDTVAGGGLFDGTAGIVAALEVVRLLDVAGSKLPFDLEVADFLCEEPSDFGLSCIGSRGLIGALSQEDLNRVDPSGRRLRQAILAVGGDPGRLNGGPLRRQHSVAAYFELHIEQGPILENRGLPLGIVTGIAGIRRLRVQFVGSPGHAGTTPMEGRRDALAAAADAVLLVERTARQYARSHHLVATVGMLNISPNAANVIPGAAVMTIEIRALESDLINRYSSGLMDGLRSLAAQRDVSVGIEELSDVPPVHCDPLLRDILRRSADQLGLPWTDLASGAGHDACQVAQIAPVAMLFIPCRGGLSHCPEELATLDDIARGATTLFHAVRALADKWADAKEAQSS